MSLRLNAAPAYSLARLYVALLVHFGPTGQQFV